MLHVGLCCKVFLLALIALNAPADLSQSFVSAKGLAQINKLNSVVTLIKSITSYYTFILKVGKYV